MIKTTATLTKTGLVFYTRALRPHLQAALQATAQAVADRAGALVPIDTGALHDSIRVEADPHDLTVTVSAGNAAVTYAPYIEYGVRGRPARPFMTPAAELGRVLLPRKLADAVRP